MYLYWNLGSVKVSILLSKHMSLSLPPLFCVQNKESTLLMNQMNIHRGVCLHNGIVHKDKDEWTVDGCTECTCQVGVITLGGMQLFSNPASSKLCENQAVAPQPLL